MKSVGLTGNVSILKLANNLTHLLLLLCSKSRNTSVSLFQGPSEASNLEHAGNRDHERGFRGMSSKKLHQHISGFAVCERGRIGSIPARLCCCHRADIPTGRV